MARQGEFPVFLCGIKASLCVECFDGLFESKGALSGELSGELSMEVTFSIFPGHNQDQFRQKA